MKSCFCFGTPINTHNQLVFHVTNNFIVSTSNLIHRDPIASKIELFRKSAKNINDSQIYDSIPKLRNISLMTHRCSLLYTTIGGLDVVDVVDVTVCERNKTDKTRQKK